MALQQILMRMSGGGDRFYDYLQRQATVAHAGASAFSVSSQRAPSGEPEQDVVGPFEDEAEMLLRGMEDLLTRVWFTPFDREDLHTLSSKLDALLGRTLHAVRARDLLGIDAPTDAMKRLGEILLACTERIDTALQALRAREYSSLLLVTRDVRALRRDATAVFEEAVQGLTAGELLPQERQASYREPSDSENVVARRIVRDTTMLEELDRAIDQSRVVAELLTYLAVKLG